MSATTNWLIQTMEDWAPISWAMETDNVGLMVGDRARPVMRVLTALDLSEEVLREAVTGNFDFIITHHPLITRHSQPINAITTDNTLGKKIMTLIANGISLYSAHTNLDVAPGGVNDLLFDLVGLTGKEPLLPAEKPTLGLIGYLPRQMELSALAKNLAERLSSNVIRFTGRPDKQVHKVGLCGGNGTSCISYAMAARCDVFITGDIGYHTAMDASENGLALIDGTHYATEIPIAESIAARIKKAAESSGTELFVEHTKTNGQVFQSPQMSHSIS